MNRVRRWAIRRDELIECRQEIYAENRSAFRLLSFCGFVISLFNYLAQIVVAGEGMPLFRSGLLPAYFALLIFIHTCLIAEDAPIPTRWMYLAQIPVMALAILLGTVWDPTHQATTILMFLMFLPAFVMDIPARFQGVQALWTLLFAGLCLLVKQPPVLYTDLIHALEFYVASCALMYVVSSVRLQSLQRQRKTRHTLTHDPDTDCQNLIALDENRGRYMNRERLFAIGVLDRLTMVNDFYGIDAAVAASGQFTRSLMGLFGAADVYLKNGKEVICIPDGITVEDFLEKLKRCRAEIHDFTYNGKRIPMTCGFGYVTGAAEDDERLHQVMQLAEIYLHQAVNTGSDQTKGGAFAHDTFRAAAAESNNSSAQPYEMSPLTGLPRLYYFTARSEEMLQNVVDVSRHPVVGFIRLTRLREYNEALGYAQGDDLIRETARQLRKAFYGRVLCHVTAGQFCVLCYRDEAGNGVRQLCDSLKAFGQAEMADCKAGFAEYTGGEAVITLIDLARIAQKSIAQYRGQQMCFYDAALDEEVRFAQYIVSHVDEAIRNDHLVVYFQPIVRAATGKVCCEEALSRWEDPEHGFLMPYRFIPALEENGLMYKVNLHVVEKVLENFRQRKADGVPVVPVSVNLSRKDFGQCDMVREITERVDKSGFSRDLIRIEITESAFIADQALLRREIARFRENGFQVWLDDFGSEYSTLNLLEEIDFDLIKIDMKFMRNFTGAGKNRAIVAHTIAMAKEMGMVTLMEGVETVAHYDAMRELGCDMLQGYLFDKPSPYTRILEHQRDGTGLAFEANAAGGGKMSIENASP